MNILVAFDESESADIAVRRGAALARLSGGALTLARSTNEDGRLAVARVRQSLDSEIAAIAPDVEADRWVIAGDPASAVLTVADEISADLIITGSRGRGQLERSLLGSTASRVASEARCDVLVVHAAPPSRGDDLQPEVSEAVGSTS